MYSPSIAQIQYDLVIGLIAGFAGGYASSLSATITVRISDRLRSLIRSTNSVQKVGLFIGAIGVVTTLSLILPIMMDVLINMRDPIVEIRKSVQDNFLINAVAILSLWVGYQLYSEFGSRD
ncbi:hypothetical protein BVU17_13785 [Haloarcula taiwanensis]|uniref:Uncharacterized protein n=1 Tax=Haloarcula taiwanensis TaxID=1932004 RepID=A0A2H5A1E5_9EURY|nr:MULTISPECIES: hypothetical protein [Haloarcula]AUG48544.1 hypothetical protein BVU17_13785 [Haloarcula taiwanensis]MUV49305.1 hypothetical protein [Haloarcula sp. CBA1122]